MVGVLGRYMPGELSPFKETEVFRGNGGDNQVTYKDGAKVIVKKQIVANLNEAVAEWEADLIGAGIQYEKEQKGKSSLGIDIHIKPTKNVMLLNDSHKRVLEDNLKDVDILLEIRIK
jgi:hypothetical protein